MYLHVFLFKWKPAASEALKGRAAAEIAAFQGPIPGLLQTYVGPNESPHGQGNDFGGGLIFASREAFEEYVTHPLHVALLNWLMPLIEPTELDLPGA